MSPSSSVELYTRRCPRGSAELCPRRFVTEAQDQGVQASMEAQALAFPEVHLETETETIQDWETWSRMQSSSLKSKLKQRQNPKMLSTLENNFYYNMKYLFVLIVLRRRKMVVSPSPWLPSNPSWPLQSWVLVHNDLSCARSQLYGYSNWIDIFSDVEVKMLINSLKGVSFTEKAFTIKLTQNSGWNCKGVVIRKIPRIADLNMF